MSNMPKTHFILLFAVLLTAPIGAQPPSSAGLDPRIEKLVASISVDRLQQLLQKLTTFKTRNTCSDPNAPDGIGAARQWIFDELKRTSPKLQVSYDTHVIQRPRGCAGPVELRNVMAVLPGKSPRRIYVSGHYDSINLGARGQAGYAALASPERPQGTEQIRPGAAPQAPGETPTAEQQPATTLTQIRDPNIPAPGANDDGSGTVLSMELARVFAESGIEFDATLVFTTVAGEEQGLDGAAAFAKKAREERIPIQAWFNDDIVGGSRGGDGTIDSATVASTPGMVISRLTSELDSATRPNSASMIRSSWA